MYRIGFSRDIHRLEKNGKDFILGGVKIPYELGNVAHSDGDCLYHAIAESLLGALGLGDLGKFFPDTDDKYLNFDSSIIVKECYLKVKNLGYVINNLDCVVVLEKPHLQKHLETMQNNIASLLETTPDCVCVKAQTNEKCGEVGNNKAIVCFANVLLRKE